ncbi:MULTISPECIES: DUF3021 domain-containing protein [Gemella]|uniref:DUF3021 domain-containing protein n=1 Tax=Gemella TaxID=1378 RepID=UPI00076803AA|nr:MULTISPECIES: DUF3021 domain-containing protein [Gemella]AME10074.1 hypothetical protein AXE85_07905 [Gemella sp. oral taxon 928]AXI26209.1 DUF3021 domain-containing protein [Gemella sp. ND 6198]
MKLIKTIFIYALLGVGIGNIITLGFSIAYGSYLPGVPKFIDSFGSVNSAVVVQTVIYMILGILQGIAGIIFKNAEYTGLAKIFIVHYILIIAPLVLAGYYLCWFNSIKTLLGMLVFSSIIYIIIAVVSYFTIKSDIKKINAKLGKYN